MIAIVISAIFLIFGISALVAGINQRIQQDAEALIGMGTVTILLSVFMGFGVICHSIRTSEPEITFSSPCEKIARSDTTTYIKYTTGGTSVQTFITDKHSFYIAKDEDIQIKRTTYKNIYGKQAWGSEVYEVIIENTKLEKESL
jgi:hypothetical protein